MSHNVHDVLAAITQASQALEREPALQAQVSELGIKVNDLHETVQKRELAIVDYKSQIEELQARIRSLEVERDQAQFRTLELEEAHSKVVGVFRDIANKANITANEVDPPKAVEPTPEPSVAPSTSAPPPVKPYEGKTFHQVTGMWYHNFNDPRFVSYDDWIAGGGSHHDYHTFY